MAKGREATIGSAKNPLFSERGFWRARIDADLGVLYQMRKRPGDAENYLRSARMIAEQLANKALLAKIDAALTRQ